MNASIYYFPQFQHPYADHQENLILVLCLFFASVGTSFAPLLSFLRQFALFLRLFSLFCVSSHSFCASSLFFASVRTLFAPLLSFLRQSALFLRLADFLRQFTLLLRLFSLFCVSPHSFCASSLFFASACVI